MDNDLVWVGAGVCKRGHFKSPNNLNGRHCRACKAAEQWHRRLNFALDESWVQTYSDQRYELILKGM